MVAGIRSIQQDENLSGEFRSLRHLQQRQRPPEPLQQLRQALQLTAML